MAKRLLAPFSLGSILLLAAASGPALADVRDNSDTIQQYYPIESLQLGEEGTTHFAVDLDENGRLQSCAVTESSGYPRLDRATCDLIVKRANFAPVEVEGKREPTTRTGMLTWRLPSSARGLPAPPRVELTKAQLDANKLLCKRNVRGGSFLLGVTYCLTQHEWDLAKDYAQQEVERMIGPIR